MSYPHDFKILVKNPGSVFIAGLFEQFNLAFHRWEGVPYPTVSSTCPLHTKPAAQGTLRKGYIHSKGAYCQQCFPDDPALSLEWTPDMIMLEIGPGDPRFTQFYELYNQFTQTEDHHEKNN